MKKKKNHCLEPTTKAFWSNPSAYDFWKCSHVFAWMLEGFSRGDITAMFLYQQQTKGVFQTTWRLKWWIQPHEHALMNVPVTHEGGLRITKLKRIECQQIHPLVAGSITVSEGTVVWKFPDLPLPGMLLFHCSVLFSTLSTTALHPTDSQLCEETPEVLKLETVLSGKVHFYCLSLAFQIFKKTSETLVIEKSERRG